MELSHTFTPASLAWLGGAFGETSAISPFGALSADGFDREGMDALVEAGIIRAEGEVTPEWFTALDKLAGADAYTRIRFRSGALEANRAVYFRGDDPSPLSLTTTPDGFTLDYPPMNHVFLEEIGDFTGRSNVVNSDLAVDLDYASARALVAVIDRERRHVLDCLAREERPRAAVHSVEAIAGEIGAEGSSGQRLSTILLGLRDRPGDPTEQGLSASLDDLVARGLLAGEEGEYRTAGEAQQLAGHLLVLDGILHIDGGRITDGGSVEGMEAIFALGGLHDILMIDPGAGSITLQTLSGAQLHRILREFLAAPPRPRESDGA